MHANLLYEKSFWGNCVNTFVEESKQLQYAMLMGLSIDPNTAHITGCENKNILDIGGGPTSLLLKTLNTHRSKVIDPLQFPSWVYARYEIAQIEWEIACGEDIHETNWDEVWIYNVLQHVRSPEQILENARKAAPVIRLFEWIDIDPYPGHPQKLTKDRLENALQATGNTGVLFNTNYFVTWVDYRL